MCSQYNLEAMMRKESRSVRCEKQGVEQTSHTLSERSHRESCPLLFRRNGASQFYVKGTHFFWEKWRSILVALSANRILSVAERVQKEFFRVARFFRAEYGRRVSHRK